MLNKICEQLRKLSYLLLIYNCIFHSTQRLPYANNLFRIYQ